MYFDLGEKTIFVGRQGGDPEKFKEITRAYEAGIAMGGFPNLMVHGCSWMFMVIWWLFDGYLMVIWWLFDG